MHTQFRSFSNANKILPSDLGLSVVNTIKALLFCAGRLIRSFGTGNKTSHNHRTYVQISERLQ